MADPTSKVIRVFLSSTFVDFQEERSLLVKQVFPSLRRRARSRGVEIVDVDLRWGVTEEQTQRGETLPLCLAEIDRCRPYFIGLLGERYGWVPPPEYYRPELLERQPWLKERMGGASVTELEILHGVLRNPQMAGHALFYLRDPAFALAQGEPGWLAENPLEQQRLSALKQEVRSSGFPVVENLADPQAIADRIEADLWAVIEQRFPEEEPLDALARLDRSHAAYRQARTGLYIGGEVAIAELEGRISADQQRIVITGESGSGKSALIANWVAHHQQLAPMDVVFCHHLDCTNDANALTPMLGRFLATASALLLEQELIQDVLKVPEDWWELTSLVATTLQNLGVWCRRSGNRWIWVLDGLDRLVVDDQQALPWLPLLMPAGVHLVVSALECPARSILEERGYSTQAIAALERPQQEALIDRYLGRYTKQLTTSLRQQILSHPQAASPLYLRVLLEELRQCASHDTLAKQLAHYLKASTVDGLYRLVLQRLEADGHGDAVRKALPMIWASRAGLSEEELLAVTGLAPLEWAPIDLALDHAIGRNGDRLVFAHAYLRKAVEKTYLPEEETRRQAHSDLANLLEKQDCWTASNWADFPWQLVQARRRTCLVEFISDPFVLAFMTESLGVSEMLAYWRAASGKDNADIVSLVQEAVGLCMSDTGLDRSTQIQALAALCKLLQEAAPWSEVLLLLRTQILDISQPTLNDTSRLALELRWNIAMCKAEVTSRKIAVNELKTILEAAHSADCDKLWLALRMTELADLLRDIGGSDYISQAADLYEKGLADIVNIRGEKHPACLQVKRGFGSLLGDMNRTADAIKILKQARDDTSILYGDTSIQFANANWDLSCGLYLHGSIDDAIVAANKSIVIVRSCMGEEDIRACIMESSLAFMLFKTSEKSEALDIARKSAKRLTSLLGEKHYETISCYEKLAEMELLTGRLFSGLRSLKRAFSG